MVDHNILLQRLQISCVIRANPLLWLKSYLSDRTQMVICGGTITPWVLVKYGVPQGSVLGPPLYCYIQPTFQPYSPNTPHLVTSMLMMCRRSSMVHLLINSLLLAALMLSLKIYTSGCLPIGYR